MTGGVERVRVPGGSCWICGRVAVAGEKLPGRRRKVRLLCQFHADAVFGGDSQDDRRTGDAGSAGGL